MSYRPVGDMGEKLNEPWRGIIDAGVVAGLGLGMLSMLGYFVLGLMGHEARSACLEIKLNATFSNRVAQRNSDLTECDSTPSSLRASWPRAE